MVPLQETNRETRKKNAEETKKTKTSGAAEKEEAARLRAKTELGLYKGMWERLFKIAGILFFLGGGLQLYLLFATPFPGPPDAALLAVVLFLEYSYFFGTVAAFLRYPSVKQIRENISSWQSDPVTPVPPHMKTHKQGITAGSRFIEPRSIVKPLKRGLNAISVTVLLASFLVPLLILLFSFIPLLTAHLSSIPVLLIHLWQTRQSLLALVPYEYALVSLGFVGMALHRLRATRAVGSALAEHATKMRNHPTVQGAQMNTTSSHST